MALTPTRKNGGTVKKTNPSILTKGNKMRKLTISIALLAMTTLSPLWAGSAEKPIEAGYSEVFSIPTDAANGYVVGTAYALPSPTTDGTITYFEKGGAKTVFDEALDIDSVTGIITVVDNTKLAEIGVYTNATYAGPGNATTTDTQGYRVEYFNIHTTPFPGTDKLSRFLYIHMVAPTATPAVFDAKTLTLPSGSVTTTVVTGGPLTTQGGTTFTYTESDGEGSYNGASLFEITTDGIISVTAGAPADGTYIYQVRVINDEDYSQLKRFTITVGGAAPNVAPVITGTPATTVQENSAYSFTPTGTDANAGDTLTYSIVNKPSWAAFSTTTGALTGTPGNGDIGNDIGIVITISDSLLTDDLATFAIEVTAIPVVNVAPVITGTPDTTVQEGNAYTFVPTGTDANAGDTLTFSITNKPSWANFNTNTGALSGTPGNGDIGNDIGIVITVSDSLLTDDLATFAIEVTAIPVVNVAPVITGTPDTTVQENSAYSFDAGATDANVGDTLTFSITNKPSWASFNTTTGVLNGTPSIGEDGFYNNIVISVSDSVLSDSLASFNIEVTAIPVSNVAPVITGTPDTTVEEGSAYSFTPSATDANVGDTLTFTIAQKPSWASFNTATGALTGTPAIGEDGFYNNVVITVSDGTASTALASFNIEVTVAPGNGTVTIAAQARNIDENSSKYTVVPGGDITVTATFPNNIEFTTDDQYFNMEIGGYMFLRKDVSLDFEDEDTYVVSVTVTDKVSGATSTADVTITLNDLNEGTAVELNTQRFLIEAQTLLAGAATKFNVASEGPNAVYTTSSADFTINSANGLLSIINETVLADGDTFTISVTVTIGLDTQAANVTIEVVDELPNDDKSSNDHRFRKKSRKSYDKCLISSGSYGIEFLAMFFMVAMIARRVKRVEQNN